uniref:Transmembrane protein 186 n=1 Tax=Salvator merianae TaxID=96440 RepID=A0A8D0DUG1_SALMN
MFRILRPHARLPFIISCGRSLPKRLSLERCKADLVFSCSFSAASVQLQRFALEAPGIWAGRSRRLGSVASAQRALKQKPDAQSSQEFSLIYKFPGIKYCRAVSRLKLLQTAFSVLILPPVWTLYWQNQVTQAVCLYCTGITCFALFMLYGMSFYLRRIIGLMYLNRDRTLLKVAHLTFWGRRKEIYCPTETVMTLADASEDKNKLLLQFRQYNNEQFLYFTLRFGQIVDREGFTRVFGKVQ